MSRIIGLDFGTTNSLATIINDGSTAQHFLWDDSRPHPSLIQYHGNQKHFGRIAKQSLGESEISTDGHFVRSPKTLLRTQSEITIQGRSVRMEQVVGDFLGFIREHANDILDKQGTQMDKVVATIPVDSDASYRQALRRAAGLAGISIHQFVQEPFAALYGYIRSLDDTEMAMLELEGKYVLVFDWGGGTLDLSLVRVLNGQLIQVANRGNNDVGGDRFDDLLRRHFLNLYLTQHGEGARSLIRNEARPRFIERCEITKISLSEDESYSFQVRGFAKTDSDAKHLKARIDREEFRNLSQDLVNEGILEIERLLESVKLNPNSISLCLATGGMCNMPIIRERLIETFDVSRVPKIDNGDRIISEGAAWIAEDEVPLTTAKDIEIQLSDGNPVTVMTAGTELPRGGVVPKCKKYTLFCANPRDGYAKGIVTTPMLPHRVSYSDTRRVMAYMLTAIDPNALPLTEEIHYSLKIDQDLLLRIEARSENVGQESIVEIQNLEFGLLLKYDKKHLDETFDDEDDDIDLEAQRHREIVEKIRSSLDLKSNLTRNRQHHSQIHGSYLDTPKALPNKHKATPEQKEERNIKTPCSICNRDLYRIRLEGCENSNCGVLKPQDCEQALEERDALLKSLKKMQRDLNSDVV